MRNILKNKFGFSIVEILVGIFIFSMGLASVYAIISSTMRLNDYNEDYIIATSLAKEQLELIKNYRDTNYVKHQKYNQINTSSMDYNNLFLTGSYYKIENNYSDNASFPILLEEISDFGEGEEELNGKMQNYKLCLNSENRYTYNCTGDNKKTHFYRYIYIDDVIYKEGVNEKEIENALKIKSKVIWYKKGYHEFDVQMIITDWKRI